jgi:hypothetical protein
MLSVVIMLSVFMLSVVMLIVVAPTFQVETCSMLGRVSPLQR